MAWTDDASRGLAQARADLTRFHVFGAQAKRFEDARRDIASLGDLTAADGSHPLRDAVTLFQSATDPLDPVSRLQAFDKGLDCLAPSLPAAAAGGASFLAGLAIAIASGATDATVSQDAAMHVIRRVDASPWTQLVSGLTDLTAAQRLTVLSQPLGSSAPALASQAAQWMGYGSAAAKKQLDDELEPRVVTLSPKGKDAGVDLVDACYHLTLKDRDGVVQAGLAVVGSQGKLPVVGKALFDAAKDADDRAALGAAVLAAMPADGWHAWAQSLLSTVPSDVAGQAAVMEAAIHGAASSDCTLNAVRSTTTTMLSAIQQKKLPESMLPAMQKELEGKVGKEFSDGVAALQGMCDRLGLSHGERLTATLELLGQQKPTLTPAFLAHVAPKVAALRAEKDRPALLAAFLGEVPRCPDVASDAARKGFLEAVQAACTLPLRDAAQRSKLVQAALTMAERGVPGDLAAMGTNVASLAGNVTDPTEAIAVIKAMIPGLPAANDETKAMIAFLKQVADRPSTDSPNLLKALKATVGAFSTFNRARSSKMSSEVGTLIGNLSSAREVRAIATMGFDAVAADADARHQGTLADCVRVLSRTLQAADGPPPDNARQFCQQAFSWLGSYDVSYPGLVGQMTQYCGDTRAALVFMRIAADAMVQQGALDPDTRYAANFLVRLSHMDADSQSTLKQQVAAGFSALQQKRQQGAALVITTGRTALNAFSGEYDRRWIAKETLGALTDWAKARGQVGETSLAAIAQQWLDVAWQPSTAASQISLYVLDALQKATPDPGGLATGGLQLMANLSAENRRLFYPILTANIESLAKQLGDETYIPQLLAVGQDKIAQTKTDTEWYAACQAALKTIQPFVDKKFAEVVLAAQARSAGKSGSIDSAEGQVQIGDLHIPTAATR